MSSVRAWLHDASFSTPAVRELDESFARTWQDQLNDAGSGQLSLQNDDPDLADCGLRRIVRFDLDDEPAFAMIIESKRRQSTAAGEEADENTDLTGRGTLALWERMVVYPEAPLSWSPFADDRLFTFAAIGFDDSGWSPVVVTPEAGNYGEIADWPDPTAAWVWDRDNDGVGVYSPLGDVYLRKAFTTVDEQTVEVRGAADDAFDAYLDGVRILTEGPVFIGQSQSTQLGLSAGDHVLAVKARNNNTLKAGFRLTMMTVNTDATLGAVVVNTDDTWVCLGYPATPPGFTPGAIVRILLEEAQARGGLADVTLGFDDDVDSDGTAWPDAPDVAFRVGLDGLSVLRQLAETYVDVAMAPDELRLDAWVHDGRGAATAAVLEAGVNLVELTHETA